MKLHKNFEVTSTINIRFNAVWTPSNLVLWIAPSELFNFRQEEVLPCHFLYFLLFPGEGRWREKLVTYAVKSAEPDAARNAFVSKQQLQTAPLWPSKVPTQSPVSPFRSMGLESEPHVWIIYKKASFGYTLLWCIRTAYLLEGLYIYNHQMT